MPVRDRPAQLERLLGALGGPGCIVVDDASADAGATREIAERHGARFVGLAANAGPAGARNAGLAASDSPIVAFVDSDCVPSEGWLEPLLGHFDDPLVAAVAPRIVPPRRRAGRRRSPATRRPLLPRPGRPTRGWCGRRAAIPYVPSAALLVRADLAAGADLFDPGLRGGEDVDLVWRLGRGRLGRALRAGGTVAHEGPALASSWRGQAFYGIDRRAARAPATGTRGAGAPVRVVAGGVAARAGPPARS